MMTAVRRMQRRLREFRQRPESLRHAHRRLQHLYEISKLLTNFVSPERTLPAAVAFINQTLPLRIAILNLELQGRARSITWYADTVPAHEIDGANLRARTAYAYLSGSAAAARTTPDEASATANELTSPRSESHILTLPLVVDHYPVFGVLQLESTQPLTELDLIFVNAVVNQIAIAVDRQASIAARQSSTEAEKIWVEVQRDVGTALQVRMREQLDFIRALTSSLDEGVIATDTEERITFLNPAAEQLLGCLHQEAVGERVRDVVRLQHAEGGAIADAEHIARQAMRASGSARTDDYFISRDTEPAVPVSCTSTSLKRGDHTVGAVLVFQDITERKRTEDVLREADRHKNEFLATLGHELRNPLAALAAASQLLLKTEQKPAVAALARDALQRQVQHMARLIDDLLDSSRVTHGKIQLRIEHVNVAEAVAAAIETARPVISVKQHHLSVDVSESALYVDADRVRLIQIFSNLLTNAAKYTDPGGELRVKALREGTTVVVRVVDSGIGIRADVLPTMFTMFSQVKSALDRSEGGLGIGLALAKSLVEMLGGTIAVSSKGLSRGSEFEVRLPLAKMPQSISPGNAAPAPQAALSTCKVLVADDNPDTANSLASLLELEGYEVQTAYDGEQALGIAGAFQPSLVLLDIGMPKMNGYEVAQRIRERVWGQSMTLVAITGWGQQDDKARAVTAGFDHHFTKPVNLELLLLEHRRKSS